MLNQEIIEKISEINRLLFQVKNYWTKLETTKSADKQYIRVAVSIYAFIEEKERKQKILAHILKEEVSLNKTTANQELEYIIEKIKELIHATNEND